jgi:transmembrane sensor
MDTNSVKILLQKYKAGDATLQEKVLLENWYARESMYQMQSPEMEDYVRIKDEMWAQLDQQLPKQKRTISLWPRIAGVAAAVAVVAFGVWFYTYEVASSRKAPRNDVAYENDVAPGKNTATLTLANGKVINLSDSKTGVVVGADKLAYNDGTVVDPSLRGPNPSLRGGMTKQSPDEVAASRNAPRNDDMMLTVATPRGGQYQITLPDGTRVWLNADSKISFPAQFIGKERRILLVSGEAYFEVAKVVAPATREVAAARSGRPRNDVRVPFIVESKGQEVEVLGTHFNINAYGDEGSTKTTLLEGSVRVWSLPPPNLPLVKGESMGATSAAGKGESMVAEGRGGKAASKMEILKPGEQAVLANNGITVKQVDVNEAIAWKQGYFKFNNEPLSSIMLKIARWYNVEVIYQDERLKSTAFGGTVSRFSNVSQVLNKLQLTGKVRFKIEGQKIIVSK